MSATSAKFHELLLRSGSDVTYHREDNLDHPCPCRTPEGFRDPVWHRENQPGEVNPDLDATEWDGINPPICNEQGFQVLAPINLVVKAAVQPISRRLIRPGERASDLLGDIQEDDKIGIFPCVWEGTRLDFRNWGEAGEDYIIYDDDRYMAVAADKLPDIDGDPNHHWEVGLRLLRRTRNSV